VIAHELPPTPTALLGSRASLQKMSWTWCPAIPPCALIRISAPCAAATAQDRSTAVPSSAIMPTLMTEDEEEEVDPLLPWLAALEHPARASPLITVTAVSRLPGTAWPRHHLSSRQGAGKSLEIAQDTDPGVRWRGRGRRRRGWRGPGCGTRRRRRPCAPRRGNRPGNPPAPGSAR